MDQAHNNTRSTTTTAHTYDGEEELEVLPREDQERKKYIFAEMRDTTGIIATD